LSEMIAGDSQEIVIGGIDHAINRLGVIELFGIGQTVALQSGDGRDVHPQFDKGLSHIFICTFIEEKLQGHCYWGWGFFRSIRAGSLGGNLSRSTFSIASPSRIEASTSSRLSK